MEIRDEDEQDGEVENVTELGKKEAIAPVEDQTTQCSVQPPALLDDQSRAAYHEYVTSTEGKRSE